MSRALNRSPCAPSRDIRASPSDNGRISPGAGRGAFTSVLGTGRRTGRAVVDAFSETIDEIPHIRVAQAVLGWFLLPGTVEEILGVEGLRKDVAELDRFCSAASLP